MKELICDAIMFDNPSMYASVPFNIKVMVRFKPNDDEKKNVDIDNDSNDVEEGQEGKLTYWQSSQQETKTTQRQGEEAPMLFLPPESVEIKTDNNNTDEPKRSRNKNKKNSKNKKPKSKNTRPSSALVGAHHQHNLIRSMSVESLSKRPVGFGSSCPKSHSVESLRDDLVKLQKRFRGRILEMNQHRIVTQIPHFGVRLFEFESVMDAKTSQGNIMRGVYHRIIKPAMCGQNATVFTYGQTGSGKTHTMNGPPGLWKTSKQAQDKHIGLIPRVIQSLLGQAALGRRRQLSISYVEIYQEKVSDLLNRGAPVQIRYTHPSFLSRGGSDPVWATNAQHVVVRSWDDFLPQFRKAEKQKKMFATKMNLRSSRSHSIFTIYCHDVARGTHCTVNLVDLAGSERIKKSCAVGDRLKEALFINKSLFYLGRCISLLLQKSPHIPYKYSVLTQLLAPALGGQCRTTLLVTCASSEEQISETINTLRFAERAQGLKSNMSNMNRRFSSKDEVIRRLDKKIKDTQDMIESMERRNNHVITSKMPKESEIRMAHVYQSHQERLRALLMQRTMLQ